jgi:hypothetical protein
MHTKVVYTNLEMSMEHGIPWTKLKAQARYPSKAELHDTFTYTDSGLLINKRLGRVASKPIYEKTPTGLKQVYQKLNYKDKSYATHKCIAIMHLDFSTFEELPYAYEEITTGANETTVVYSHMIVDHINEDKHDNRIENLQIISSMSNNILSGINIDSSIYINSDVNQYCQSYLASLVK